MRNTEPPTQTATTDIRRFDVIRVSLKKVTDKVTVVVLDRMFNVRKQLISFDVFPVESISPGEQAEKVNSFAIYSEGYKEQMGLPFDQNFKISFKPVTLLVGNVGTVEKIGYVGMGNAKEIVDKEFTDRAGLSQSGAPAIAPAFVVKPASQKPVKPAAENPTLYQLSERGQLSEYTRWVFSGLADKETPSSILAKSGSPLLDAAGKEIVVKTLRDADNLIHAPNGRKYR